MQIRRITSLTTACALATSLGALAPSAARADMHLALNRHTDAFAVMGQQQPARDEKVEYWFGSSAVRRDSEKLSVILRVDEKKLYVLNHAEKTYSALDLPIDFAKLAPAGSEQMFEQMTQAMAMTAKVTPTEEREKISTFDSRKFKVELSNPMGMSIVMDLWITKDLALDWSGYRDLMANLGGLQPGGKWMEELAKLDGFPVREESTMSMMGSEVKSHQELVSSAEAAAPAGSYAPPADYTLETYDPMAAMKARQ